MPDRLILPEFARRHATSAPRGSAEPPPPLTPDELPASLGGPSDKTAVWVPGIDHEYAPILDHGRRSVTRGVVIHVNAGYAKGTDSFFRNGQREPYGSEGVGAHFEISGKGMNGKASDSIYADFGPRQYVPLDRETWHAVEANGFSVGVEHAGFGRSRDEWLNVHHDEIGHSAYIVSWILHRFNLGPPHVSTTNVNVGNVWPHSCGGASWGGHECPGPEFPWDVWTRECRKAYTQEWRWK